jgi:hypothetical protein
MTGRLLAEINCLDSGSSLRIRETRNQENTNAATGRRRTQFLCNVHMFCEERTEFEANFG